MTITKQDLINLGYGNSFSANIIREAKILMVQKRFPFYKSRKLNRVPREAVEEILGFTLPKDIPPLHNENQ